MYSSLGLALAMALFGFTAGVLISFRTYVGWQKSERYWRGFGIIGVRATNPKRIDEIVRWIKDEHVCEDCERVSPPEGGTG